MSTDQLVSDDTHDSHDSVDFAAVYNELREIALSRLKWHSSGLSLHATLLVHEAFIRLERQKNWESGNIWSDKSLFLAAASECMRRIVIDNYRRRKRMKHGGQFHRIDCPVDSLAIADHEIDLLDVNDVLDLFERHSPEKAELVKLRIFANMTMLECANALGLSLATTERYWRYARAWLADRLSTT